MAETYVVIDLETTGLDQQNDDIIEVAAVKIRRGLIIDEFSSLVKPSKSISEETSYLTGINNDMVADMPDIYSLLPQINQFTENAVIIAHNASFDRNFLTRYWADDRQWLDSLSLAQIVFPCAPSHSLAWLCQYLDIDNNQAHRALSDAIATAQLFCAMVKEITGFSDSLKLELIRLAEKDSSPIGDLLRERCKAMPVSNSSPKESLTQEKKATQREFNNNYILNIDEIGNYLGKDSQYAHRLPCFEERPQQLQLSQEVAKTFNNGGCLLAEAGTGTGKSMAYLLPAALYSQGSGKQIAISTHTRNLQEQLINKDIPLLAALLDRPVKACSLKGRSNYLCKRLHRYFSADPSDEMRYFLMRLAVWRAGSNTGECSELSLTSYAMQKWSRLCASKDNCAPFCPFRQKKACYVQKARIKAAQSDIVVLNHSLLIANAANDTDILPELPILVIDEAQHLEDVTEDQLTTSINFFDILSLLGRYKRKEKDNEVGVLSSIKKCQNTLTDHFDFSVIDPLINKLYENIDDTVQAAEKFYDILDAFFSDQKAAAAFVPLRIRITAEHRQHSSWSDLRQLGEELAISLSILASNSFAALDGIRSQIIDEQEQEQLPRGFDELFSLGSVARELAETLRTCISQDNDNYVAWAEYPDLAQRPSISTAPIEISEILLNMLYEKTESLVLTSATLTTGGNFDYFKHRTGLDLLPVPPKELTLPSPFYYQDQALLTVVNDLPDWSKCSEVEAADAIAQSLIKLITASKGKAIVLFTSHSQLRNVFNMIKNPLRDSGITVLAHGISGSPSVLLERLKKQDNCCILGAASFWEGVDVIGDSLSLIIVVRLPFWPPNTPLAATIMERIEASGKSSFYEYSLPMALIRFKQGFGRLIRSDTDSGIFCVLDKRIIEKRYGKSFINSLPDLPRICGSTDDIAAKINKWFDN